MPEVILTDKQLQERLKYWQERLRLRDWDIEAEIVPLSAMDDQTHGGENTYLLQSKASRISILNHGDYQNMNCIIPHDMEETLVHELLHLHFAPFDSEKNYMPIEQAIESLAKAFVETDRQKV
ncbi:hypothetical protein OYT88_04620 [Sporolactobacillus sp. CQH2019]|uniref:hypothetical protein n=1 Tax=Sporolactobacillus sp. CQH2019 TaxID=3023512 RepID=UPI00236795D4|nr:hypothetical protein [Sporolactobacillus sp. CQH2019]MDD9147833.1 hypothetical protein [Sporolactobacillus sp. CQH2019]